MIDAGLTETDRRLGQLEYRDVAGFPGYKVGSDGSVWSSRKWNGNPKGAPKRLSPGKDSDGYLQVTLYLNRKMFPRKVHRIVLEAFVGLRPKGWQCLHGIGGKTDNSLGNIRWGTPKENREDMRRDGTDFCGERHPRSKLSYGEIIQIRLLHKAGASPNSIARGFGVTAGWVRMIVRGIARRVN